MTEIGEAVSPPEFISDDKHDENTCPWCSPKEQAPGPTAVMDPQTPDEDSPVMPKNLGEKLGKNLGDPPQNEVWVQYTPGTKLFFELGSKKKEVQAYGNDEQWVYQYELQFAPHHLIPGNESLKGNPIVAYLGDDNAIKHFKGGVSSKIKTGLSSGYDVNRKENGVWLPSPYALSNTNQWPSVPGIKVIKKRLGETWGNETEDFTHAYVAEAIRVSGNRQFHMRHKDYSVEVKGVLKKIADKLKLLSEQHCPEIGEPEEDGKIRPPMGLTQRLDVLSNNLRNLLIGPLWRPPIYTDTNLMTEYAKSLTRKDGAKGTINKVI